jgi:hypothetical protein
MKRRAQGLELDRGEAPGRRRRAAWRRPAAVATSLVIHGSLLAVLLSAHVPPAPPPEPEPIIVQLIEPVLVTEPSEPIAPTPAPPSPAEPPPPRNMARETPLPPPPDVAPVYAGDGPSADGDDELSDDQVASAAKAGDGPPGGACNMPRLLQRALRKDRLVQAAVAQAHRGKAIVVWNGSWVRHGEQEGAGLAAVREAIMWEIGFASEACRTEPVRGLVLISLNDGPGSARLVMGSGQWRWKDLLFSHVGVSSTQ